MSWHKEKCCEPHTRPISFTCYLAQIRRGVVKNSPVAKLCETTWPQCGAGSHLPVSSSHPSYLAGLPHPPQTPHFAGLPASSCWCETCWIIDDLVCWLNWKNGFFGSIQNEMLLFFLNFLFPSQPKFWNRNAQTSTLKEWIKHFGFEVEIKRFPFVLLGQNKQRRNKGRITRDRE